MALVAINLYVLMDDFTLLEYDLVIILDKHSVILLHENTTCELIEFVFKLPDPRLLKVFHRFFRNWVLLLRFPNMNTTILKTK